MGPTQLPWQVRTALVVTFAAVLAPVVFYPHERFSLQLIMECPRWVPGRTWVTLAETVTTSLLAAVLVAISLGLDGLLRRLAPRSVDDAPRCRHCGHVIVGLSMPRVRQ